MWNFQLWMIPRKSLSVVNKQNVRRGLERRLGLLSLTEQGNPWSLLGEDGLIMKWWKGWNINQRHGGKQRGSFALRGGPIIIVNDSWNNKDMPSMLLFCRNCNILVKVKREKKTAYFEKGGEGGRLGMETKSGLMCLIDAFQLSPRGFYLTLSLSQHLLALTVLVIDGLAGAIFCRLLKAGGNTSVPPPAAWHGDPEVSRPGAWWGWREEGSILSIRLPSDCQAPGPFTCSSASLELPNLFAGLFY